MISKVGRPSDVPRLYAHGNSDGEMHAGFCVIYLWAAGRCRRGERGQAGTAGLGAWAPVRPLGKRQVQEVESTLSQRRRI
jgi:hypothetical protein